MVLVSVLGCRFGYETGGMFRILIGVIFCLEFWKAERTRCKQCVKYVDDESQSKGRRSQTVAKTKSNAFPRQLPGACVFSVLREVRDNGHTFVRASIEIL
jgi:hypothetical protein